MSFIFLALLFIPASVAAKSTYSVGIEAKETIQYQPVSGTKYQPLIEGILDAFALEEGIKIDYRALPPQQYQEWFDLHPIDFRFPDHPKWSDWHNTLFYSQPVINFCEVIRLLPENNWMRRPDIKRLGTLPNHPLSRDWERQVKKGYSSTYEFQTPAQLVNALLSGQVDAILAENTQIDDAVAELAVEDGVVVSSQFIPDTKDSLRISSERYPALLEKLDRYIKTHQGYIALLARRHGIDNGRACTKLKNQSQSEPAE
ncbi:transporter substrate-binding domain-containing protein [Alteromonas sp. C1M14]|uniref:transporter substrate-binding domain-containing protein n=1 Tax=Alteromonas sp. C1M14 TaxID=2841567 RepID=UPI001C09C922|nr:transporter substrate-binding domain-containing protein [Alteromonas sp. C1M14]MBU2977488.1 transporter substrate-binding domain-containing protein [Alteromonas sp. C1M14]